MLGTSQMIVRSYVFVVPLIALASIAAAQGARDVAIDRAKATLAREIGVSEGTIAMTSIVESTWRDSSLGCPERGVAYTPMLSAGYAVGLSVGTERFVVHVASGRAVVCGRPRPLPDDARDGKLPPADVTTGLRLAEQARLDLAGRLRVGKETVVVNFFRPTMWPDASLGCPVKDRAYAQEPAKGFLIELASQGKSYEYHSDMNRVVPCPESEPER